MVKSGILIDPHTNFSIVKRASYDDRRIEELYVKFEKELVPAAYVYPIENEAAVQQALDKLKQAKKAFDDIQAEVYYEILPKLRS